MKTSDVKLGSVYLTRIGGALCPVTVTAEAPRRRAYSALGNPDREGPARFYVKRHGETERLPKPRTAAALREVPAQTFHMKDQPWLVLVKRAYGSDPALPPLYGVSVPEFDFVAPVEAKSAAHAAVYGARAMLARAVFGPSLS